MATFRQILEAHPEWMDLELVTETKDGYLYVDLERLQVRTPSQLEWENEMGNPTGTTPQPEVAIGRK